MADATLPFIVTTDHPIDGINFVPTGYPVTIHVSGTTGPWGPVTHPLLLGIFCGGGDQPDRENLICDLQPNHTPDGGHPEGKNLSLFNPVNGAGDLVKGRLGTWKENSPFDLVITITENQKTLDLTVGGVTDPALTASGALYGKSLTLGTQCRVVLGGQTPKKESDAFQPWYGTLFSAVEVKFPGAAATPAPSPGTPSPSGNGPAATLEARVEAGLAAVLPAHIPAIAADLLAWITRH